MYDNIKKLKTEQKKVYEEMKAIRDDLAADISTEDTQTLNKRFEEGMAKYDSLENRIRILQLEEETNRGDLQYVTGRRSKPDIWTDKRGKEVEVITRDTRLDQKSDVSIGAYMRAILMGPRNAAEERALSEGTDNKGGYTTKSILSSEWFDMLRQKTQVVNAGSRMIKLDSDSHSFAKVLTDPVAAFRSEAGAVSESDPTYDSITFLPRSLATYVKVSTELLEDSVNIEDILKHQLTKSVALAIDTAALSGSGTPPTPEGIVNYTNLSYDTAVGANGASLTNFDYFISAINGMLTNNAAMPSAFLMHPRTLTDLSKLKDSQNQPLQKPDILKNIPILDTTGIGITDTQGSASNASKIIMGDFSQLLIGVRSELKIEVLKELFKENLQVGFLVYTRVQILPVHEQSFAVIKGITPS